MSRAGSSISSSEGGAGRRGILAATLGLGLAGCGFRPLYGPPEAGLGAVPDGVRQSLAAIRVGPIPERTGQLMRRELQRRLEGLAPGTPARYQLAVALLTDAEVLAYRRDGTISRVRFLVSADWVLTTQAVPPVPVARSARPIRAIDAFNVPDLQFFAADTARDVAFERLIETLSLQIVEGLALQLRDRPPLPAAPQTAALPGPAPDGEA